jgi:hypothetical protein
MTILLGKVRINVRILGLKLEAIHLRDLERPTDSESRCMGSDRRITPAAKYARAGGCARAGF